MEPNWQENKSKILGERASSDKIFFLLKCDIGCLLCKQNFKTNLDPSFQPHCCCHLVPPKKTLDPPVPWPPFNPPSCPLSSYSAPWEPVLYSANLKPSHSLPSENPKVISRMKLQCQNCPLLPLEANKSPSSILRNV